MANKTKVTPQKDKMPAIIERIVCGCGGGRRPDDD
jgi:hypothetical protein